MNANTDLSILLNLVHAVHPSQIKCSHPLNRMQCGPQRLSRWFGKKNNLLSVPGTEPRSLWPPGRSSVTTPTELIPAYTRGTMLYNRPCQSSHGAGNFGKIRSAYRQHEIQHTEWRINNEYEWTITVKHFISSKYNATGWNWIKLKNEYVQ